ncbi:MFS transporter [Gorillibacterium timonense]|uniref:MFS transporter n=1 Tax=Gorillibacterium timonense TaxID=1689269 RepID=UPI00071E5F3E|nr:glycoside-pentoside-hexuronide (GPH):cation symporter [Gorillibacterium timonense]
MEKVKKREKLAYGLGDLGNNVAYGAMGFYLVFFLTDVAGLSPLWAGAIFMIVRMWNAVFDLISGAVSDRTRTRFGRRRPYLLYGAIPLSLSFALLWQLFFQETDHMILYYTLTGILFSITYSLVSIPYNSLLPEMSQDYDERTSISGYKMALSFIGSLVSAMGVTLIVDTIYPGKTMYAVSYPVMGLVLGAVIAVCVLLAFAGTKERVEPKAPVADNGFWKTILSLFKLREYRLVLGVFIGNMLGFDVIMALYIYFMKYALKVSSDISYIFMAIPLVVAVAVTPLWVHLSNKMGKQKTYILSALYFLIPLISCLFLPEGNMVLIVVVIVFIGVGLSASQVLTFSILPDVVEVDELKNGVRREGMIYGSTMFFYKISSAVMVAVVMYAMGLFGYVESAGDAIEAQPSSAVWGIRLLISCVPALCFVLSALFVRKLPSGKAAFDQIKQSVADKKECKS